MNSMTHHTRLPAPAARHAHVVTGTGRPVSVSGRLAPDEDGRLVGAGDAGAQVRQVVENPRRCPTAGARFDGVVDPACLVTDMAHTPAVRAARAAHPSDDRPPAASAGLVTAPARPVFLPETGVLSVVDA